MRRRAVILDGRAVAVRYPALSGAGRSVRRRNQVGDMGNVAPQVAAHVGGHLGQRQVRLGGWDGAGRQVVAGVAVVAGLGRAVVVQTARRRVLVDVVARVHRRFVVAAIDRARGPDGLERHHDQQQYQQKTFHQWVMAARHGQMVVATCY